MISFFVIGIVVGYYLSIVSNKIAQTLEEFYIINSFYKVSYVKEILLEFAFLKYFLKIDKSDLSITFLKKHIFHSFVIALTFLAEYYYYKLFHFEFYKLIMILFGLSILYVGIITDIKTNLIPDVFIIIPSVVFIFINYPNKLENIFYFFAIYFSSYLIYYIQIKINKFLIGIQDIKLYALSVLLFGISKLDEIIFLSSCFALLIFIYKNIKYKNQIIDFGLFIYIALVSYPLIKIFRFDF